MPQGVTQLPADSMLDSILYHLLGSSRLLKNTHLLRYAHPSSLQRTCMYASFLRISRALHLDVFEQPAENYFFNNRLVQPS
jgi:hypothetical protein